MLASSVDPHGRKRTASLVSYKFGMTRRADGRREGQFHSDIPISQIGQSSPMVVSVSLAIWKLAIPLTARFRF
jgi:hypothetical protein